jgi:hypothetical protein
VVVVVLAGDTADAVRLEIAVVILAFSEANSDTGPGGDKCVCEV